MTNENCRAVLWASVQDILTFPGHVLWDMRTFIWDTYMSQFDLDVKS
jgi:hypothetical protein